MIRLTIDYMYLNIYRFKSKEMPETCMRTINGGDR